MTETKNYNLNQWDAADAVRREDFNSDNAAIDAALHHHDTALQGHTEAIAKLGNCRLYTATYTGTGSYTASHTFPGKPLFVIVGSAGAIGFVACQGTKTAYMFGTSTVAVSYDLTWEGNTITWTHEGDLMIAHNLKGRQYFIMAFLKADE